jgi:hypothetical protein
VVVLGSRRGKMIDMQDWSEWRCIHCPRAIAWFRHGALTSTRRGSRARFTAMNWGPDGVPPEGFHCCLGGGADHAYAAKTAGTRSIIRWSKFCIWRCCVRMGGGTVVNVCKRSTNQYAHPVVIWKTILLRRKRHLMKDWASFWWWVVGNNARVIPYSQAHSVYRRTRQWRKRRTI